MPFGIIFLDLLDAIRHHVFANGAKAAERDPRVGVGARLEPARHRLSGREAPNGRAWPELVGSPRTRDAGTVERQKKSPSEEGREQGPCLGLKQKGQYYLQCSGPTRRWHHSVTARLEAQAGSFFSHSSVMTFTFAKYVLRRFASISSETLSASTRRGAS